MEGRINILHEYLLLGSEDANQYGKDGLIYIISFLNYTFILLVYINIKYKPTFVAITID